MISNFHHGQFEANCLHAHLHGGGMGDNAYTNMILKYELPPLGCAALGAPSLDSGPASYRNRIFRYPNGGTVYPPPRTLLFSSQLVFCYIENRGKWAISDETPPPPLYLYRQTHNHLRILFCYLTSNTSNLEKSN